MEIGKEEGEDRPEEGRPEELLKACPFCQSVLKSYPKLERMTPWDSIMFRTHLEKAHGFSGEILP